MLPDPSRSGPVAGDAQVLENLPDEHAETVEHELLMAERDATLREAFACLPLPSERRLALARRRLIRA